MKMAMTDSESKKVYHVIRVIPNYVGPPKDLDEPRTHIVYKGVSANNWFSPFGISQSRKPDSRTTDEKYHKTDKTKYVNTINEQCLKTVQDRAKSANSIMGRRHFEIDKQDFENNEMIHGISLSHSVNHNNTYPSEEEVPADNKTTVRFSERVAYEAGRISKRSDARWVHPRLNFPAAHVGYNDRPKTAPSILKSESSENSSQLPDLSITRLLGNKDNPREPKSSSKSLAHKRCVSAVEVRDCSKDLDSENLTYRSVSAMKEAYQRKVQDDQKKIDQNLSIDLQGKQEEKNETSYQVKPSVPEKRNLRIITPRNRFHKDNPDHIPRSNFKPLLYNQDYETKHSPSCPYMCKGCFQACLASDDYLEEKNRKAEEKIQKLKKKMGTKPSPQTWNQQRQYIKIYKKVLPDDERTSR